MVCSRPSRVLRELSQHDRELPALTAEGRPDLLTEPAAPAG